LTAHGTRLGALDVYSLQTGSSTTRRSPPACCPLHRRRSCSPTPRRSPDVAQGLIDQVTAPCPTDGQAP